MKLTIQLKLLPTPQQADALRHTLETANAACDYISRVAWQTHTFSKLALQKLATLGSRRRLHKLAGQERRFAKHINHTLSKRIVAKAECTKRAIALEELTHFARG